MEIRYFLDSNHFDVHKEEVKFSIICLKYLSFPCFDDTASDADIKKMIWTGDYAFAEYAIIHWRDHLRVVLENEGLDKQDSSALEECADTFLSSCSQSHSNVDWAPNEIKSNIRVLQRQEIWKDILKIVFNCQTRAADDFQQFFDSGDQDDLNPIDLGLDKTLLRMRSILYDLCRDYAEKYNLEKIYGADLFKCSRTDCQRFFEGFPSIRDQQDHEANHDRLCCNFEGCVATFVGRDKLRHYRKHVNTAHVQQGEEDVFPETVGQSFIGALKEAVQDRDQETIESMISQCETFPNVEAEDSTGSHSQAMGLLFAQNRIRSNDGDGWYPNPQAYHWSTEVWKQALKDPNYDVIRCLTNRTKFKGTNAQAFILETATNSGLKDLVKHFTAEEYYRGQSGKSRIPWHRAIEAAIKRGDGEILQVLVDAALKNSSIGLETFDDERLRYFCLKASRIGALSCVKYFVDEHLVDPFSSSKRSWKPGALSHLVHKGRDKNKTVSQAEAEKIWNNRSVLFQAVLMGHDHIVAYLQPFRIGHVFSTPNSCEKLIQVAVVNGHERILAMLVEAEGLDESEAKKFKALSRLHSAIRTGKEQYAKLLIRSIDPLDFPDRNYCTPILYAAKHGMEEVVIELILKNVNVDQLGMLEDSPYSRLRKDRILVVQAKDVAKGGIRDLLKEASAE
jgi:hypothetical protein